MAKLISKTYADALFELAIEENQTVSFRQEVESLLQILKDNAAKLNEIAAYLLERETITGEEFMEILKAGKENAEEESETQKAGSRSRTDIG